MDGSVVAVGFSFGVFVTVKLIKHNTSIAKRIESGGIILLALLHPRNLASFFLDLFWDRNTATISSPPCDEDGHNAHF